MPVDHPDHPSAPVVVIHARKLAMVTGFIIVLGALFVLGMYVDVGAILS